MLIRLICAFVVRIGQRNRFSHAEVHYKESQLQLAISQVVSVEDLQFSPHLLHPGGSKVKTSSKAVKSY